MPRDPAGPGPGAPPVGLDPLARRALRGWLILGAGALAVAGALALLLAIERMPGIDVSQDAFRKILVSHVVFAFVLWFWAMLGGLAVAARGNGRVGMIGLSLAVAGAALVLIPALAGWGEPVLANYVPVLTDPMFLAGLALFAIGVVVAALGKSTRTREVTVLDIGFIAAYALFIESFSCVAVAWMILPKSNGALGNVDTLSWVGGHVLQFAYTALALTGWQALGEQAFGRPPLGRTAWKIVCRVMVVGGGLGFFLTALLADSPETGRTAFTWLYWIVLPVPVAAMVTATSLSVWRGPRDWRSPAYLGVFLSLALFLLGGLMGLFADGTDTRTPAHYHAEIGGVNLALIGLIFAQLLPALGRGGIVTRAVRLQFWLYGIGQAAASLGLFLAGAEGVPRKLAGVAQGLDTLVKQGGMGLAGGGGVVAVAGGVLFIWLALRRLLSAA